MKYLIIALCSFLLLSLCNATVYESTSATIPLFVWSNRQIFSSKQILETLEQKDIESLLNTLIGTGNNQDIIVDVQELPEVVVIFVEPQLQTDQIPHFGAAYTTSDGGSFSVLKKYLASAKSSLVAPYATAGTSFSLLEALMGRISTKVNVVLAREQGSTLFNDLSKNVDVVSIHNIKDSDIFTNGRVDVLVVCLDSATTAQQFATHDAIVETVTKVTSVATSDKFVGIYTGNSASSNTLWTFPNPNAALIEQPTFGVWEVLPTNTSGNNTVGPRTYFTGPMLEVFMVVIALLTMVFVGICNICSLQVPETFEAPKPQQKIL